MGKDILTGKTIKVVESYVNKKGKTKTRKTTHQVYYSVQGKNGNFAGGTLQASYDAAAKDGSILAGAVSRAVGDGNERAGYIVEINGVVSYSDFSVGRLNSRKGVYQTIIPKPNDISSLVGIFHVHPKGSNEFYGPGDLTAAQKFSTLAGRNVRGYVAGSSGNLAVIDDPLSLPSMNDASKLGSSKFRIIQSNGYLRGFNGS